MHKAVLLPAVGLSLWCLALCLAAWYGLRKCFCLGQKKERRVSFSISGKSGALQQMVGKEKQLWRPAQSEMKIPHLAGEAPREWTALPLCVSGPYDNPLHLEAPTRRSKASRASVGPGLLAHGEFISASSTPEK